VGSVVGEGVDEERWKEWWVVGVDTVALVLAGAAKVA